MVHGRGGAKKRPRNSVRSKQPIQQYPSPGSNSVKPIWKDIPLSNFDLLKWVDFLKIPNFKGIYSRDDKDHVHKTGCCIINLDDRVGNGTHWVATFVKPKSKIIYYFDSFSLPPPMEFLEYAKRSRMRYKYNSGYPIQDINSVRCGYFCLYFLDNIWRKSFYDCLKVFDLKNPQFNENFIKHYFS